MKRTERHHLKDNELAQVAANARAAFEEHRTPILLTAGVVVLALAAAGGYLAWRGRSDAQADVLLAQAMTVYEARVGPPPAPQTTTPPDLSFDTARAKYQAALTKFKIVADQFPTVDAGLFARYRQASIYMELGEPRSAADTYQQVIDSAGDRLYGQMARLGLAEAQVQTGQFDEAIATLADMAQKTDGVVPVDGVLFRLGRTYREAGKVQDAEQTFNRIVTEFPDSPFAPDAQRELADLKRAV